MIDGTREKELTSNRERRAGVTITMMMTTRDALEDLQWNWGDAYAITGAAGHWVAQRRDNGRTLTASSPDGLRELITEDYEAQPVPREATP